MAVDEVLLGRAALAGCQLRVYRWSEPTLSLGYFQNVADRRSHAASSSCRLVRRPSGGGAILHDREITYSLALPWSPGPSTGPAEQRRLFRRIHGALLDALRQLGVPATLCPTAETIIGPVPFMCFQRRAEGDVLIGQAKIAGSAQRRVKGALLQHGSILLEASPAAPELCGIHNLAGVSLPPEEWQMLVSRALLGELGWQGEAQPLSEAEQHAAARLVEEKLDRDEWTQRR